MEKTSENPWQVSTIQDFSYLNCPECSFKTKENCFFEDHALKNHPLCYVLFGNSHSPDKRLLEFSEVILEKTKYDSEKYSSDYFIEVKDQNQALITTIEEPIETQKLSDNQPNSVLQESNTNIEITIQEFQNQESKLKSQEKIKDLDAKNGFKHNKTKVKKKSLAKILDDLENGSYKCYYCDELFSRLVIHIHGKILNHGPKIKFCTPRFLIASFAQAT